MTAKEELKRKLDGEVKDLVRVFGEVETDTIEERLWSALLDVQESIALLETLETKDGVK